MYSLQDYGQMLADSQRLNAYREAILSVVHPDDAVLEIGCGPAVFAFLACQAGARKVYAIDLEEIVHFARELAGANGFSDRMDFIQGDSRKVELPERVDVVISDIRGSLPFFGHAIASLEDARRLLKPGGRLIPQRDTLKAAVIDATDFYSKLVSPWSQPALGLDLSPSVSRLLNGLYGTHFRAQQLLTESQAWAELDYSAGPSSWAGANLSFTVTRVGQANGLCLWFDTELIEGIGYSSGPGAHKSVYGQMFLPFLEPVSVQPKQKILVNLKAHLVGDDYVWEWETKICGCKPIDRHFVQSTFYGADFTPHSLRRRAGDFVPSLSDAGKADSWLLQAMDGHTSLQQIAQRAAEQFPEIFPRWENALNRAADLARRFSR